MLHKALALIGVQDFTELEAAKLTDRFADLLRSTPPGIVSFDLWCRITSPASLLLAKEKISQDVVPTVFETMAYIQTIAGAMVGVLFGFLPKPTTDFHTAATTTLAATANTTITRLPFPLIYDPLKNDSHRAVDCATLILILMWAGFFIWSLRRRGTVLGQRYGYASLACATGVVSILLATINPELIIVFVLCLAVFGVGVVRLG